MEQYFYVLFNTEVLAFYLDNQLRFTKDILVAERYDTDEEAKSVLKYFEKDYRKNWTVKKVTVSVEL